MMSSVKAWKPAIKESCFNISVKTPNTRALLAPSVSSRFSSSTLNTVLKLSLMMLELPVLTILMMLVMACLLSPDPPAPVFTVCSVVIRSFS